MIFKWFERLEEGLLAFLLAVMTCIVFTQVIARYIFNYSFVWALETVTYLFAGLIFFGMSYGVRVGAHIGIDLLVKSLGPLGARIAGAIAAALCILYSGIVLVGSIQYVHKIYSIGILAQDLPIEQWIPRMVLPIGFTLLGFRFAQILFRILTGKEAGLHLADEAAEALKMNMSDPAPPTEGKQP